jgi:ABC-type antimicrobial peptide transport system permease subunit
LTQLVALESPTPNLLGDIRRELAAIDPGLVLYEPRLLTDVIGLGISQERFALIVIGAYALLALLLAGVGLYGVLSYSVRRRQREMSLRMALGAETATVRSLVMRDGLRLTAIGVAIGLVGAAFATRALASLLFGVSPTDPAIFAAASATLIAVSLGASWLPARLATQANPIEALRAEA